jgi:hypothetical protein
VEAYLKWRKENPDAVEPNGHANVNNNEDDEDEEDDDEEDDDDEDVD